LVSGDALGERDGVTVSQINALSMQTRLHLLTCCGQQRLCPAEQARTVGLTHAKSCPQSFPTCGQKDVGLRPAFLIMTPSAALRQGGRLQLNSRPPKTPRTAAP